LGQESKQQKLDGSDLLKENFSRPNYSSARNRNNNLSSSVRDVYLSGVPSSASM
jgi:hypothetical protein